MISVEVHDATAMTDLGRRLGAGLRAGDAVCLTGRLGAGKTTLTRGIAAGLGVTGPVSSPTFVISRRYPGRDVDLIHCDAYRLSEDDDFADVVPDAERAVTVIEWGSPVMTAISDSWLEVEIVRTTGAGDETRWVRCEGVGRDWAEARVRELLAEAP